ncbi:MAG: hypothetical protein IJQ62_13460, partial [Clostridia bacterium]|nr:hypothetical protein [Clostridia bacterium]
RAVSPPDPPSEKAIRETYYSLLYRLRMGKKAEKKQYQKRTVKRMTFRRIMGYTESGLSETGKPWVSAFQKI